MNDRDNASNVERFLDGAMSPDEAREFALLVERDGGLKAAVDAERMIRRAVDNDLHAIPPSPDGSRARILRTAAAAPRLAPASPEARRPISALSIAIALFGAAALFTAGVLYVDHHDTPSSADAVSVPADTIRIETPRPAPQPESGPQESGPTGAPRRTSPVPISAAGAQQSSGDSSEPRITPLAADTLRDTPQPSRTDSAHLPLTISPTKINRPKER